MSWRKPLSIIDCPHHPPPVCVLHAYLQQQIIGQQPGLVLLSLGAETGDAVVAEGFRVFVGLGGVRGGAAGLGGG